MTRPDADRAGSGPAGGATGPDLLVAGGDEAPWSIGRRRGRRLAAVLTGLALLAGSVELVSRQRAADRRVLAQAVADDAFEVALGDGSRLPRHGRRAQGIHVELVNTGPRDVQLLNVEVRPGADWRVVPEPDGLLPADGSVVLRLLGPCAEDDPVGEGVGRAPVLDPGVEPPGRLELTARLVSGRTTRAVLDLVDAPLAYGGDLDQALPGGARDLPVSDLPTAGLPAPCH